jgi:hypothetical protein
MTKMAPITRAQTAMSMSHPLVLANLLDRPQPDTLRLIPVQRARVAP